VLRAFEQQHQWDDEMGGDQDREIRRGVVGPRQGQDTARMARILLINPNCSQDCSDGISAALARFRVPGAPVFEVVTLQDGPPAI
jgi:hypothetical protein